MTNTPNPLNVRTAHQAQIVREHKKPVYTSESKPKGGKA